MPLQYSLKGRVPDRHGHKGRGEPVEPCRPDAIFPDTSSEVEGDRVGQGTEVGLGGGPRPLSG